MRVYDIILHTPLGKRKGELKALIENGRLNGFLSVLGHTEPMEGTVDESGRCALRGKFVSLMKSVSFTADGTIAPDALRLAVKGDVGYEIVGRRRDKKERDV